MILKKFKAWLWEFLLRTPEDYATLATKHLEDALRKNPMTIDTKDNTISVLDIEASTQQYVNEHLLPLNKVYTDTLNLKLATVYRDRGYQIVTKDFVVPSVPHFVKQAQWLDDQHVAKN